MATAKKKTVRRTASKSPDNKFSQLTALSFVAGSIACVGLFVSTVSTIAIFVTGLAGITALVSALKARKVNPRPDVWIIGLVLGVVATGFVAYVLFMLLLFATGVIKLQL